MKTAYTAGAVLLDERGRDPGDLLYNYFQMGLAECLGSAALVFFGSSAGLHSADRGDLLSSTLLLGMSYALIFQVLCPVSGANISPTISICFWVFGYLSLPKLFLYICCQIFGAYLGFFLLMVMAVEGAVESGGGGVPPFWANSVPAEVGLAKAVGWEYLGSALLALVVSSALDPRNAGYLDTLPLKLGIAVWTATYLVGPYTGGGLNMARSLAPALYWSYYKDIWVFLITPSASAFLTSVFYWMFLMPPDFKGPPSGGESLPEDFRRRPPPPPPPPSPSPSPSPSHPSSPSPDFLSLQHHSHVESISSRTRVT